MGYADDILGEFLVNTHSIHVHQYSWIVELKLSHPLDYFLKVENSLVASAKVLTKNFLG